jgi:hypothetical protein
MKSGRHRMDMNRFYPLRDTNIKKLYLMNQLVVLVREYPQFGLSKIRYVDETSEFIIDSKSLTEKPVINNTINIYRLGGGCS